jgi:hypothetical protein
MSMAAPLSRAVPALLLLALPTCLASCKSEQIYGEVEGTVTLEGKPLADVEVVFLPDPEKGNTGKRAVAFTDAKGRYRLASDGGRAGAPVGFHRVCVNDLRAGPSGAPVVVTDDAKAPAGTANPSSKSPERKRGRFPDVYSSAGATPLRDIEIKPGPQSIPIELKLLVSTSK